MDDLDGLDELMDKFGAYISDAMKGEMREVITAVKAHCEAEGLDAGETQHRLNDAVGAVMSKHMSGPTAQPSNESLASGEYTSSWEASTMHCHARFYAALAPEADRWRCGALTNAVHARATTWSCAPPCRAPPWCRAPPHRIAPLLIDW